MAGTEVFAPRYADAFAAVAREKSLDVKAARQQMRDFADTLQGSPQLLEVLEDPSILATQKLGLLDALAERIGMYREVRNFFAVIIEHQRTGAIEQILEAYHQVADAGVGLVEAEVTSARELDGGAREQMEFEISKLAVSRVSVSYKLDPALIGGAVVRIGSTVYDGSVRGQLAQMKSALVKG
jgi:F-type H+-transporting ATPase subunit delta